jgi:hypothetical protein
MTEQEAKEYAARYPCVRCGYCCQRGPCGFGQWDYDRRRCTELVGPDSENQYTCAAHDRIMQATEARYFGASMFGCGCSSPLGNTDRNWRIRKLNNQQERING